MTQGKSLSIRAIASLSSRSRLSRFGTDCSSLKSMLRASRNLQRVASWGCGSRPRMQYLNMLLLRNCQKKKSARGYLLTTLTCGHLEHINIHFIIQGEFKVPEHGFHMIMYSMFRHWPMLASFIKKVAFILSS